MDLEQLAKNHLQTNKVKAHHIHLIQMMHQAVKEGFHLLRIQHTIFAYIPQGNNVYFSIVDGGSPREFMRASRHFVEAMHHAGFKTMTIYTDKPDYAKHVLLKSGAKYVDYKRHDRPVDPFLMRADI